MLNKGSRRYDKWARLKDGWANASRFNNRLHCEAGDALSRPAGKRGGEGSAGASAKEGGGEEAQRPGSATQRLCSQFWCLI